MDLDAGVKAAAARIGGITLATEPLPPAVESEAGASNRAGFLQRAQLAARMLESPLYVYSTPCVCSGQPIGMRANHLPVGNVERQRQTLETTVDTDINARRQKAAV